MSIFPLPESRMAIHPNDGCGWAHVQGTVSHLPHNHIIPDTLPVEQKNDLATHIDRWHKRVVDSAHA